MKNFSKNPDVALLIRAGSPVGKKLLYENYASVLYGAIIRTVKDTGIAENLLQSTIEKICNCIGQYDADQFSFVTWILQLARSVSISYVEKVKNYPIGELVSRNGVYDKTEMGAFELSMISSQVNNRPAVIFNLILEGYSVNQVAEKLNLSAIEVKTDLRTGMKMLSKSIL